MHTKNTKQRRGLLASFLALVMTAATLAVAAPVQAEPSCGTQFSDSEAPDEADCSFECKSGQQLRMGVDASDEDATASGSAHCGGGYTPCKTSGSSCRGSEGVATNSATGTCSAVVNELWNSAWSYNCEAKDIDGSGCVGPSCGGDGPDNCILGIVCCPAAVCVGGGGTPTMPCLPATQIVVPGPNELLERVQMCGSNANVQPAADSLSGLPAGVTSRIDVWVPASGLATGRLCNTGVGCWSILPVCFSDLTIGRMECSVPESPKLLGPAPLYGA